MKCLPPGNRPGGDEVRRCNAFLRAELEAVPQGGVVLALGQVAHQAVLRSAGATLSRHPFRHGSRYSLDRYTLVSAYHRSRYNVRVGRLTESMLDAVFRTVKGLL